MIPKCMSLPAITADNRFSDKIVRRQDNGGATP